MSNGEAVVLDPEKPQFIEEGPSLPALLSEDFVAGFEKGVARYKRWVAVCYRLTRETHWINHGKPGGPARYYLQGPGAEALMNPLAISFDRPTLTKLDLGNGDYAYRCEGYLESKTLGRRGYYEGYCDSLDQFFTARPGWNRKTGEGDVRKASATNWIVNGVTRIGGLRDPDPAMLQAAGLDPAKIPTVDYSGRKTPEQDAAPISEGQLKRLWAIARGKSVSEQRLRDYVLDKYGVTGLATIRRGDYDSIVAWAETGGPDWDKTSKEPSPGPTGNGPARAETPKANVSAHRSATPTTEQAADGPPDEKEAAVIHLCELRDAASWTPAKLGKLVHSKYPESLGQIEKLSLVQLKVMCGELAAAQAAGKSAE